MKRRYTYQFETTGFKKSVAEGVEVEAAVPRTFDVWEVFNLFNRVNFATPNNDLQDRLDLGTITNTVGGPRVMQFGLKLRF